MFFIGTMTPSCS